MSKNYNLAEKDRYYTECQCGCGEPVLQNNKYKVSKFVLGHQNRMKNWGSIEERFWSKVDKVGPDDCWAWTGANCGGEEKRGVFWYEGKREKAPRVSLILAGFALVDGDYALHKCNNANCVNPKHLYWGTPRQNTHDQVVSGTLAKR